jgi:hypothetical protein
MTLTCAFDPSETTHQQLRTDQRARTLRNFQLVWTDTTPTTWEFAAYIVGLSISHPMEDMVVGTVTLEISGKVDPSA